MTDVKKTENYVVVVIGGGAAGIAVAARLRLAKPDMSIAIIEPSMTHAYQPAWTLVGAGVMDVKKTIKQEGSLIPKGVTWIAQKASEIDPENMNVTLDDGRILSYRRLVVCPGIQIDWGKIKGLQENLGKNGVTSNYDRKTAPYTWECVKNLGKGTAIFTQPTMPIKCAGAPQKAVYLSSDHWRKSGILSEINVKFCLAGDKLFGVAHFVPSLQKYIDAYGVDLHFKENLIEIKIEGDKKEAIFQVVGTDKTVTRSFDMIHVVPPQSAPDFIAQGPLANAAGWLDVDAHSLQHVKYETIFGLGDVVGTSNAKTAAAARDQAPIVAHNLLASLEGKPMPKRYDGYGACPLTVEYGRVVLAEFLYGGKVAPTFPFDQRKPSRLAWWFKTIIFPKLYWYGMLRGIDPIVKHKVKE